MRNWFFDVLTILSFFFGVLGVYLSLVSGETYEFIRDNISMSCVAVTAVIAIFAYHYYHKCKILCSIIEGRDKAQAVIQRIHRMSENKITRSTIQTNLQELSEICQLISGSMRKFHFPI